MKTVSFKGDGFEDYVFLQEKDRKLLAKVNKLLKDIDRNGNSGLGKPEALKGDLSGWWSREIDKKNRLVYRIEGDTIVILQCMSHYGDT